MRFEHLVQINDPLMPLLTEVSRAQLWRGLVLRAEDPAQFIVGLEGATIDARRELSGVIELERTLDYGSFKVRDRVRLMPEHRTEIRTAAGTSWPASRMTIMIEEPSPDALFLRFVYEAESEVLGEGGLDEMTVTLRQQAYEGTDLDTVVRIRALVEAGQLG
jgi:Domain of unknown function (DUF1857)